MQIDIITIFPNFVNSIKNYSIIKKAIEKKIASINVINLREYSTNKHKKVDDYPYGGEAGMVMNIEPIYNCITTLKKNKDYDHILLTIPDGELLNQKKCNSYSLKKNIIILCGHYKGIDERVKKNLITGTFSIGKYCLTGGEIAAMVFCDSIIRLIPGVIGNEESALTDTYQDNMISHPVYTRPKNFMGLKVPDILLSGNHKKIESWKEKQSEKRTDDNSN